MHDSQCHLFLSLGIAGSSPQPPVALREHAEATRLIGDRHQRNRCIVSRLRYKSTYRKIHSSVEGFRKKDFASLSRSPPAPRSGLKEPVVIFHVMSRLPPHYPPIGDRVVFRNPRPGAFFNQDRGLEHLGKLFSWQIKQVELGYGGVRWLTTSTLPGLRKRGQSKLTPSQVSCQIPRYFRLYLPDAFS